MARYLLSAHTVEGASPGPATPEEMKHSFEQINRLEDEMESAGAWVFSGALSEPDTATVVRVSRGEVVMTDGPFVESKEHLGGFYVIEAKDLDAALAWAAKVTGAINAPVEVRPFMATGRLRDAELPSHA
jgi:hypothetical protein